MRLRKSDLEFIHYRWQKDTSQIKTPFYGKPSRRLFDPLNGDQVLFIINYYGSLITDFNLKQAREVEKHIAYLLPPTLKSEISVLKWLQEAISPELPN